MELFSEIYSSYYLAVEKVLKKAAEHPLSSGELQDILSGNSFSESAYFILPKLQSGDWPLVREETKRYSAVCVPPETGLTNLQKSWLKALLHDPRFSLFFDVDETAVLDAVLSGVKPLYSLEDFYIFDGASDGDDFQSETYRKHFRTFLTAIRIKTPLYVEYEGGKGHRVNGVFWPYKLEYSQKDDKFRAVCRWNKPRGKLYVLNIGRVSAVREAKTEKHFNSPVNSTEASFCEVTLEITRERNAFERCMVHFAHFEKRTEYDENTNRYTCTVRYNASDETEIVVRVLSFGPTVKVLGPEAFIDEIRRRVKAQGELL